MKARTLIPTFLLSVLALASCGAAAPAPSNLGRESVAPSAPVTAPKAGGTAADAAVASGTVDRVRYLWPESSTLNNTLTMLTPSVVFASAIAFVIHFVDLKKIHHSGLKHCYYSVQAKQYPRLLYGRLYHRYQLHSRWIDLQNE